MNKQQKITFVILTLIILTLIVPVIIGCFYGLPSADDFSNSLKWKNYAGNHIKCVFEFALDYYKTWQGTYTGLLICGIPIYYLLGLNALRACMILTILLFVISCHLLIRAFTKLINIPQEQYVLSITLILLLAIFYLFSTNDLDEIFYWYTGIGVYTFPLGLSLLSIYCYINHHLTTMKRYLILGIIFAIGGAGGALDISAFLCSVLLFGITYQFIVLKSFDRGIWIGFAAILGSIINTIAPGNFTRHTAFDEKIRPISALLNTIYRLTHVLSTELKSGFIVIIVITILLFSSKTLKNSTFMFKYPFLVTIYGLFGIIITDFPVLLGYSDLKIPNRVAFVEHTSIFLYLCLITFYWGGWISKNNIFDFNKTSILILSLICIISFSDYLSFFNLITLTPYRMIHSIRVGHYNSVVENELSIIEQLNLSTDSDVVVYSFPDSEDCWTNIKRIELSEDKDYWVNYSISQYYNKNSITLQYIY